MKRALLWIAASMVGTALLLAWPTWPQPHWAFALLGGIVLAEPSAARWVAPSLCLHDVTLWGAPWHAWWALGAWLWLPWADARIGPGIPQRAVWGALGMMPLLIHGWPWLDAVLSALAMTVAWRAWGDAGESART